MEIYVSVYVYMYVDMYFYIFVLISICVYICIIEIQNYMSTCMYMCLCCVCVLCVPMLVGPCVADLDKVFQDSVFEAYFSNPSLAHRLGLILRNVARHFSPLSVFPSLFRPTKQERARILALFSRFSFSLRFFCLLPFSLPPLSIHFD